MPEKLEVPATADKSNAYFPALISFAKTADDVC
jgi:hypothetical protein